MHTHPCATESKRKGDHALFAGVNTLPEASAVGNESFHLWDIECAFMDYSVHAYCLRASVCSRTEACIVSCNIARVIFGCEAVLQTLTLSLWDCFACFVLEKALFFILSQFYCRFGFFKRKQKNVPIYRNVFMATFNTFYKGWNAFQVVKQAFEEEMQCTFKGQNTHNANMCALGFLRKFFFVKNICSFAFSDPSHFSFCPLSLTLNLRLKA